MKKELFVADLVQQENRVITSFFLVHSKEIRSTKEGKPYLALRLGDQTGVVEARVWDLPGPEAGETEEMGAFEADDFVKVQARVELYRDRPQLKIEKLRRARPGEVDWADFFPRTEKDVEAMYAELRGMAAQVTNSHLRELLLSVLDDGEIAAKLKQAPGAKSLHHAYLGGLLEHIVSLCQLCQVVAGHYKALDLDLLLVGAILHDLGKIDELSYPRPGAEARAFDYTTPGRLLGHIVLALEGVNAKMDAIASFPEELRRLVQHLLVSHHGRLEFGSPVVPQFREAVVLHYLDDLDSKLEAIESSLAAMQAESEWTAWNRALERQLFRRERSAADTKSAKK